MSELVVTGLGLVTSLGIGAATTWEGLMAGRRGLAPISLFETNGQRASIAASVQLEAAGTGSRGGDMALVAAREAMAHAEVAAGSCRAGLVVAGTTGGMLENERSLAELHARPDATHALVELLAHPITSSSDRIQEHLGPFARVRTVSSACSSGANAILVAAAWLLAGDVDVVVAGGTDALCRLTVTGFNSLMAMDPEPSRPFDRRRRGLNLGEGAGFLVLERATHAARRGARSLAGLAGWAMGTEAHHVTQPDASGVKAARVLRAALARARVAPSDLDYVNAHGTGTALNDPMETAALTQALGSEVERVLVSSSKAQIGHTLGAAGAVEAAITVLSIVHGAVPPTAGLEEPDAACNLQHVPGLGRERVHVRAAMSNSFGFGGMNSALVFTSPDRAPSHPEAPRRVVISGAANLQAALDTHRVGDGFDVSLDAARARRLDRAARIAAVAVDQALREAGAVERAAAGLVLSSAFGNVDASAAYMHRVLESGPRSARPAEFPNLLPSAAVGHVSILLGIEGPSLATADLATSGESACLQALELVAAGEADLVVGGAIEERSMIAERRLAVLFDRREVNRRDRSEGASALVFESEESAARRHHRPLARVLATRSWRGTVDDALAGGPDAPAGARVYVPRHDTEIERIVARSSWARVPTEPCVGGEHEGLGAAALSAAAAAISRGEVTCALVVGLAVDCGYAFWLGAAGEDGDRREAV